MLEGYEFSLKQVIYASVSQFWSSGQEGPCLLSFVDNNMPSFFHRCLLVILTAAREHRHLEYYLGYKTHEADTLFIVRTVSE